MSSRLCTLFLYLMLYCALSLCGQVFALGEPDWLGGGQPRLARGGEQAGERTKCPPKCKMVKFAFYFERYYNAASLFGLFSHHVSLKNPIKRQTEIALQIYDLSRSIACNRQSCMVGYLRKYNNVCARTALISWINPCTIHLQAWHYIAGYLIPPLIHPSDNQPTDLIS